jgi:hypothetical protein
VHVERGNHLFQNKRWCTKTNSTVLYVLVSAVLTLSLVVYFKGRALNPSLDVASRKR